jgi:hypothetical protein
VSKARLAALDSFSRRVVWAPCLVFFALVLGLLLQDFLLVGDQDDRDRLRAASQESWQNAEALHSRLDALFAELARSRGGTQEQTVESSLLEKPLVLSRADQWRLLLPREFVMLEGGASVAALRQWNLARQLQPRDGVVGWHEDTSQKVFLARAVGKTTHILCLSPADVAELFNQSLGIPNTDQTALSEKNTKDRVRYGVLVAADARVTSLSGAEPKQAQVMYSSDPLALNEAALSRGGLGPFVVGRPRGSVELRDWSPEMLVSWSPLGSTNLVVVALAESHRLSIEQWLARRSGFAALLIGSVLAMMGLVFALRLVLARHERRFQESMVSMQDEERRKAEKIYNSLLSISEWNGLVRGGEALSFASPRKGSAFAPPAAASDRGVVLCEVSPNWAGRFFFAQILNSDCYLVLLIDGSRPQIEAACIFLECFVGTIPADADVDDWMASRLSDLDVAIGHVKESSNGSVRGASLVLFSLSRGVIADLGDFALVPVAQDHWMYFQAANRSAESQEPFDPAGNLTVFRMLRETTKNHEPVSSPPEQNPAETQVTESACHWLSVVVVAVCWLLFWTLGEVAQAAPGANTGFRVEGVVGSVTMRPQGTSVEQKVLPGTIIPIGSELSLMHPATMTDAVHRMVAAYQGRPMPLPEVTIEHASIGKARLVGPAVYALSEDFVTRNRDGIRMTETEDIPSRVEIKESAKSNPMERLFAYLVPHGDRSLEGAVGARNESQKKSPIVVRYPDRVALIKTNTLPTSVTLDWVTAKEHAKPYRVFVWREDTATSWPMKEVSSTTTAIQLSEHGRYYWQVEDRLGNFSSAPRTILLQGLDAVAGDPGQTDPLNPKKSDVFRDIGVVPVSFPLSGALVYGCPSAGDSSLPVRFHHLNPAVTQYSFRFEPSAKNAGQLSVEADEVSREFFAEVPIQREGTHRLRIIGKGSDDKVLATSEVIGVTIYRACGLAAQTDYIARIFDVTKGKRLPDIGMIHIMDGAY